MVGGLKLLARLSLLTEQDLWTVNGLPNENNSSDHLPLLAKFRLELWLFFDYVYTFLCNLYSFSKTVKLFLRVCMLFIFAPWSFWRGYVKCLELISETSLQQFSVFIMKEYFPDKWYLNALYCKIIVNIFYSKF